jgi:hypothetical protein
MRTVILLATLAASACSPNRDDGGGGASGSCSEARCDAHCRSAGFADGSCGRGSCECAAGDAPGDTPESCGDGRDNDGDGMVDEECDCTPGSSRSCFDGPAEARNRGTCRDGTQSCVGSGEFAQWGLCRGQVPPRTETCDGTDDDCDGMTDEGCPGGCAPVELGRETACGDGLDNECDGLVDCADPDCASCCGGEQCGDRRDNDCDTLADEDCPPPCIPAELGDAACTNGLDDDCDGQTDCVDIECLPVCCTPEACEDGIDNDCDGAVDCDDGDCCAEWACSMSVVCGRTCCVPGAVRWCDTPTYCSWGQQTCRPDGRWGTCEERSGGPDACNALFGWLSYDVECCVDSGACCQNYGYDPALPLDASVGACDGIIGPCV